MKAILLIDAPEELIGTIGTDIQMVNIRYKCNWKLKPIPEKKQHEEEIDYEYGYIDGWNACIEEIEK